MSFWANHPPPNGFWQGPHALSPLPPPSSSPLTPPLTPSTNLVGRLPSSSVHGSPESNSSNDQGSHSARSSSPYSLTSHEAPSIYNGSSVTSAQSDCVMTPEHIDCTPYFNGVAGQWSPYQRCPTDHFLLVGTVPRDSTDAKLKQAFKSCGDLIGIFVRFLSQNGVIILAFHDARQCLQAHLSLHNQELFPDVRPLNTQLLSPDAIRSLIGDSVFVSEAQAALHIVAEAFVNSAVLYGLLLSYGELAYFQPTNYDGTNFVCEYFDGRHAREAIKGLHENTTRLGVRLQVSLRSLDIHSGTVVPAAITPVTPGTPRAHLSLPPSSSEHQSSTQSSDPTSSEDDNSVFVEEPEAMDSISHVAMERPPRAGAQPAIDDHTLILPSRQSPPIPSRRCSTGSAFCPGETTPLERFRASSRSSDQGDDKESGSNSSSKTRQDVADLYDPVLHHKVQQLLSQPAASSHHVHSSASRAPTGAARPNVSQRRIVSLPNGQRRAPSSSHSHANRSDGSWRSPATGAIPFPFATSPPHIQHGQVPANHGDLIYTTEGSEKLPPRLRTHPASNYILPGSRSTLDPLKEPLSPRNVVDLEKIEKGLDTRTTIMIKNVPSRMTHDDMYQFITKDCPRSFDFLYLRMDFVTGNNVGYAFVNFVEMSDLLKFLKNNLGKRWNLYSSEKTMQAAYATYQGKSALVTKFQNSSILDREKNVQPHIYYTSGPDKGLEEPFPAPNDTVRKARSLAAANEYGLFNSLHRRSRPPRVFGFQNSYNNNSTRALTSGDRTHQNSNTSVDHSNPFTVKTPRTPSTHSPSNLALDRSSLRSGSRGQHKDGAKSQRLCAEVSEPNLKQRDS
ncbi:hypothetical protein FRC02_009091 [Tulasnella sp. 418]|nr:hypothetical protein FRC02_009091 [Tulasnella sp. 418]